MRMIASLLLPVVLLSCKSESKQPQAPTDETIAPAPTTEVAAAHAGGVGSVAKQDAAGGVIDAAATKPNTNLELESLASVAGPSLRAWLPSQRAGGKRLKASKISQDVGLELRELGRQLYKPMPPVTRVRLRWVRILGDPSKPATTVAFSVSLPDANDPKSQDLRFSVARIAGDTVEVHGSGSGQLEDYYDVSNWGFGKDRDVDGDGLLDTIVTFSSGASGGGENYSHGLILLTTTGQVAEISTATADSEFSEAGYSHSSSPVLGCWGQLHGRPALFLVLRNYEDPRYEKTAKTTFEASVLGVAQDGRLKQLEVYAAVATGEKPDLLKAWRRLIEDDAGRPSFEPSEATNIGDCPGGGRALLYQDEKWRLAFALSTVQSDAKAAAASSKVTGAVVEKW